MPHTNICSFSRQSINSSRWISGICMHQHHHVLHGLPLGILHGTASIKFYGQQRFWFGLEIRDVWLTWVASGKTCWVDLINLKLNTPIYKGQDTNDDECTWHFKVWWMNERCKIFCDANGPLNIINFRGSQQPLNLARLDWVPYAGRLWVRIPLNSGRCSIVVSTSRCGRDIPGSNPGTCTLFGSICPSDDASIAPEVLLRIQRGPN